MYYQQYLVEQRPPKDDQSRFVFRMGFVWDRDRERIFKDRLRLSKIHPMNAHITRRFGIIPFEELSSHVKSNPAALDLFKQCCARVLAVQFGQFAHDLATALILQHRHHHLDGHDLVAALVGPLRVLHAPLPHA